MKKLSMLAFIYVFLVSFTATDETILSDRDKQNSIFFKMSRNSNRTDVFEQLQANFRIKSSKAKFIANQQVSTTNYTTVEDVIEVLGEPNVKIGNNSFIYTLNPRNGCKAVIEFDNNKVLVFIGVKDCN